MLWFIYQYILVYTSISFIWNPDQLYEIMVFRTYLYVLVYTEYVLVIMVHTCMYWYIPSMY